jgi:hypothetical protein
MSCLTEIKNLPLSRPIEIEPAGFSCQGIGSNFHHTNFGFGRLRPMRDWVFRRFVQILGEQACTFTVPSQFESILYSFFWAGSSLYSNTDIYTSFFYIYFQKHNTLYIYKWFTIAIISNS